MAATAPALYPLSNVQDPNRPLTDAERYRIITPVDPWTDQYAATVVNQSLTYMENFLQQANHYTRWQSADEQFVGWRPQQIWEGSRKPKANVPVFLLFSQIMSLLPQVLGAMFPLHENIDVAPRPGSTIEQAKAAWELIMAQLEALGEDGLTRFRTVADRAFFQAFLYGNGIVEITWLYKIMERLCYDVDWVYPSRMIQDEFTGLQVPQQYGKPRRIVKERKEKYMINQPDIRDWDIRDVLVDPNCRTPNFSDARMAATRQRVTIGELITYRNQPGFNIPDDYTLVKLAESRNITMADTMKRASASMQSGVWNIQDDYTTNPYEKTLELCRWFSRERNVWMLNRTWVAFNKPNTYKVIPLLNAFYVPFPNRFHGLALSDVTEGDQHLQASLLEARLNELSLALSAPFVRQSGTMLGNPGTIPMSPSKVIDVQGEPAKVIQRLDVQAQTQQIYMEVNDSERRASKTTGLSDMAVMGVATAGGNSAQRTAAGVDALKAAAGSRIQYLIENAEASFIEPLCVMLHMFNCQFLPREEMIPIMGVDGQQKQIDPVQVLQAYPRFTMRAAARMKQRQALMQVLPWFVQTIMNPEFLSLMAEQQNQTLNAQNLFDLIMDTINAPKIDLFRKMTPQEIQQRNAPPPQEVAKMQQLQTRLANAMQMAREKGDTELLNTLLGKLVTPRVAEDTLGLPDAAHRAAHTGVIQSALQGIQYLRPPLLSKLSLPNSGADESDQPDGGGLGG